MGEGAGEDASVVDIHGTGRVSLSRHYNFFYEFGLCFAILPHRMSLSY